METADDVMTPIYELRYYTLNPKDFNTAMGLVHEHIDVRTKHSKLLGFWTTDIGDEVAQFVHIWEYESMSHRHRVEMAKKQDVEWNTKLLQPVMKCVQKGTVELLSQSPGCALNLDFQEDSSAVYILDEVEIECIGNPPDLCVHAHATKSEILVGRFCTVFGQSKTEYRLWRYTDVDEATKAAKRRAMEKPFDGCTTLLLPTEFSPLK